MPIAVTASGSAISAAITKPGDSFHAIKSASTSSLIVRGISVAIFSPLVARPCGALS